MLLIQLQVQIKQLQYSLDYIYKSRSLSKHNQKQSNYIRLIYQ